MFKKMRKFLNHNKFGNSSEQTVLGSLTVVMLLLLAVFTVTLVITPQPVQAAYTDYLFYKVITISSTFVDSTVTNMPLWFHNTSANFASYILSTAQDIAFYDSTNSTRFNHEIEIWNSGTGELGVWVNVTSVAHDADTIVHMFYGDVDTLDSKNYNPTGVWDGHFQAVYHLNETGGTVVNDSTANDYDAEFKGSLPRAATAKNGDGQQFFHGNNDSIVLPKTVHSARNGTMSVWTNLFSTSADQSIWYDRPGNDYIVLNVISANDTFHFYSELATGYEWQIYSTVVTMAPIGATWYRVSNGWENNSQNIMINDTVTMTATGETTNFTAQGTIGCNHNFGGYMNGTLDELRFSDIKRTDDWLNVSYRSQNETPGFITFGAQAEGAGSTFSLKGLPNDQISWQGTAGNSVWCNATGTNSETMEINMSIGGDDNVTEIRVWVGDLNDSGAWVNGTNITLYVSNASNISFYSFGAFADGGSNISINETTWNTYAFAIPNPFNVTGLYLTNTSIFCRFLLAIPPTVSTDSYYSATSTTWKVHIGYLN